MKANRRGYGIKVAKWGVTLEKVIWEKVSDSVENISSEVKN